MEKWSKRGGTKPPFFSTNNTCPAAHKILGYLSCFLFFNTINRVAPTRNRSGNPLFQNDTAASDCATSAPLRSWSCFPEGPEWCFTVPSSFLVGCDPFAVDWSRSRRWPASVLPSSSSRASGLLATIILAVCVCVCAARRPRGSTRVAT